MVKRTLFIKTLILGHILLATVGNNILWRHQVISNCKSNDILAQIKILKQLSTINLSVQKNSDNSAYLMLLERLVV